MTCTEAVFLSWQYTIHIAKCQVCQPSPRSSCCCGEIATRQQYAQGTAQYSTITWYLDISHSTTTWMVPRHFPFFYFATVNTAASPTYQWADVGAPFK